MILQNFFALSSGIPRFFKTNLRVIGPFEKLQTIKILSKRYQKLQKVEEQKHPEYRLQHFVLLVDTDGRCTRVEKETKRNDINKFVICKLLSLFFDIERNFGQCIQHREKEIIKLINKF